MDLREKSFLAKYNSVFTELKEKGYNFEILFLEADEEILMLDEPYIKVSDSYNLNIEEKNHFLAKILSLNLLVVEIPKSASWQKGATNCSISWTPTAVGNC